MFLIIASMIGGLALFLYGMGTMSETLSNLAGGTLDKAIDKITKNRYIGFLAGALLTGVVQSSSATTVLTVGFVNAGILKLKEAAGLIIGANLGATLNAWILSLNTIEGGTIILTLCKPTTFVPFFAMAGVLIKMIGKTEKKKIIGNAIIGFAVMMTGMSLMSQAIAPLREIPSFKQLLVSFNNPFIGFLFALLFTMLIQSSDATVGILQAIAMSAVLTRGMVIPLICGAQVGTCITALISSLGTSNNGKRAAFIHLYYNLLKAIPLLAILYGVNAVNHISGLDVNVNGMDIPLIHTLINFCGAAIYLPLSGFIVKIASATIPFSQAEKRQQENVLEMLDPKLLINPAIALRQVRAALLLQSRCVSDSYEMMLKTQGADDGFHLNLNEMCDRIAGYKDQIHRYLVALSEKHLDEAASAAALAAQNICISFGRTGELIRASYEVRTGLQNSGKSFSQAGNSDLSVFTEAVREIVDTTVMDFEYGSRKLTKNISVFREVVSQLHSMVNKKHIKRLHEGICDRDLGTPFMDICYNLEKIIDECDQVALNLLPFTNNGAGIPDDRKDEDTKMSADQIKELYRDKYLALLDEQ